MKVCTKCKLEQAYPNFSPMKTSKDGFQYWCKTCKASFENSRRRSIGIKERFKRDPSLKGSGFKVCLECNMCLPVSAFSLSIKGLDGVSAYCKPCQAARARLSRSTGKHAAYVRSWRSNNQTWRSYHAAHQSRRRSAKIKADTGNVTSLFILHLYEEYLCFYCGKYTPRNDRTIEHITPLSRGGLHDPPNLAMACGHCNFSKGQCTFNEFVDRAR